MPRRLEIPCLSPYVGTALAAVPRLTPDPRFAQKGLDYPSARVRISCSPQLSHQSVRKSGLPSGDISPSASEPSSDNESALSDSGESDALAFRHSRPAHKAHVRQPRPAPDEPQDAPDSAESMVGGWVCKFVHSRARFGC
jgi:hypothetical protein